MQLIPTFNYCMHKSFSLKEFRGDTNLGSLPRGVSSHSEKLLCTPTICIVILLVATINTFHE